MTGRISFRKIYKINRNVAVFKHECVFIPARSFYIMKLDYHWCRFYQVQHIAYNWLNGRTLVMNLLLAQQPPPSFSSFLQSDEKKTEALRLYNDFWLKELFTKEIPHLSNRDWNMESQKSYVILNVYISTRLLGLFDLLFICFRISR